MSSIDEPDDSESDGNASQFDSHEENQCAMDETKEAGEGDCDGDSFGGDVKDAKEPPGHGLLQPGDSGCGKDGDCVVDITSDEDIAPGTHGVGSRGADTVTDVAITATAPVSTSTCLRTGPTEDETQSQLPAVNQQVKPLCFQRNRSTSKMILENNDDPLFDSDPTPGEGEHEGNEVQSQLHSDNGDDNPPGPARPELPEQRPAPARADEGGDFKSKVRSSKGHEQVCKVVLPVLLQTLKEPMWQNSESRIVLREALRRFLVHESRSGYD